ncbi:hypothetical protein GQ44DRAFT_773543 [Phaeosphaeriaceae sp. PMI808]|nr:hypothetical protein GQ44DRAFT_773543 [Phaeosphaeriaceae sp. PMI808]
MPSIGQYTGSKADVARNAISQNEESFRAEVRRVRAGHKALEAIFNPAEFEPAAQALKVYNKVYGTVWPDDGACPPNMRHIAIEEIGRPIHTDLEMTIAILRQLLESTEPVAIKLAKRFHGGGGTGQPIFEPWLYCADLEYTLETRNMIVTGPSYCFMPERSSSTCESNIASIWRWLFHKLEPELRSINSHFTIDWEFVYMFGVSYGGHIAILSWLATMNQECKPPCFRVRALILRCPVTKEYRREPGFYVGTYISRERAEIDSKRAFDVLESMPWMIP